jgi:hypothetical protein
MFGPPHIVSVRFGSTAAHITQSRIAPPSIATPLQYNTAQANVSYMMFQGYPTTQMTKTVNNTASETAQLASTHASPHLNSESWVPVVPSPQIPPVYRLYLARRDSADARRFRPSSFARRAKCHGECHATQVGYTKPSVLRSRRPRHGTPTLTPTTTQD